MKHDFLSELASSWTFPDPGKQTLKFTDLIGFAGPMGALLYHPTTY
jgi:hypothetical protein